MFFNFRYARKHFGSVDVTPPEELRKIMTLLAFKPETVCEKYKVSGKKIYFKSMCQMCDAIWDSENSF